jgi:hypothetical protein
MTPHAHPASPNRRQRWRRLLALVALTCIAATAFAQPAPTLSPPAAAIYQRWLTTTCVGDELYALQVEIRRHAAELAPAFLRALAAGSPAEDQREVRAVAESRFDARQKFPIGEYSVTGVSPEALAVFRRVPRQAYVDDQVRRYVLGYRANAVAGLGVIADAGSRAVLARIARDERNPLAPAAREALRPVR